MAVQCRYFRLPGELRMLWTLHSGARSQNGVAQDVFTVLSTRDVPQQDLEENCSVSKVYSVSGRVQTCTTCLTLERQFSFKTWKFLVPLMPFSQCLRFSACRVRKWDVNAHERERRNSTNTLRKLGTATDLSSSVRSSSSKAVFCNSSNE